MAYNFPGEINIIHHYERALSASEILALYLWPKVRTNADSTQDILEEFAELTIGGLKLADGSRVSVYDGTNFTTANELLRLGVDSSDIGLFLYDTSGTKLAQYANTGIKIFDGGDITIEDGGDITLNDGGNVSIDEGGKFIFDCGTSDIEMAGVASGNIFYILPTTDGYTQVHIGNSSTRHDVFNVYTQSAVNLLSNYSSSINSFITAYSDSTDAWIWIYAEDGSDNAQMYINTPSGDIKIEATGNISIESGGDIDITGIIDMYSVTGTPSNTSTVQDWWNIKIGGTTYYVPVYQ